MEEIARKKTTELLNKMELPFEDIDVGLVNEKTWRINILSNNAGLLIGFNGETLRALQHLVSKLLWDDRADIHPHYVVDVDNYKERQEKIVLDLAIKKAEIVKKYRNPQILPPMTSYYRKKIHLYFTESKDYADIITESIGDEPYRQLKLSIKSAEN